MRGIVGIDGCTRGAASEFGGDGLAEDDRAGPAQCGDAGGIGAGPVAVVERRIHFRRIPGGVDDVLDGDRAAVKRRQRTPVRIARRRFIGSGARQAGIERDKSADRTVAGFNRFETTLEKTARRGLAAQERFARRRVRAQGVDVRIGHGASVAVSRIYRVQSLGRQSGVRLGVAGARPAVRRCAAAAFAMNRRRDAAPPNRVGYRREEDNNLGRRYDRA